MFATSKRYWFKKFREKFRVIMKYDNGLRLYKLLLKIDVSTHSQVWYDFQVFYVIYSCYFNKPPDPCKI